MGKQAYLFSLLKICKKCFVNKNINDFSKSKTCKDGYFNTCKFCLNEQNKKRQKERIKGIPSKRIINQNLKLRTIDDKEYYKNWRLKNKERIAINKKKRKRTS